MNKHAMHNAGRQGTLAALPLTSPGAQAAADAIYKVAEVARALKCATNVVEKLVHLASATSEHLTLLHWLVLVRLARTPTCRQLELKSDTKIAAAYLTRLLDDLTREGLVRRHRSSSDRRQILLSLTEHGRRVALELLASLNDVTQPSRLNAIDHLGASLENFVSLAAGEGWLGNGA
ncbi:MAG TPA: MarR family winged helix-turn-helix transcriptional regulator [Dyella sp.]|uniref:MarR family winged helix-turn-helix transcriptional regulator n=1 Tax=Dyella sp. TaxID=1869338 RepID=UPI002B5691C1|nr:MarR family winged helix-turn-helix transcriptional regulator [Dyella sp.]HUB89674.1 MarR family winged helix-turn-helix transcriptional regulator [Dyella sp.]